MLHMFLGLRPFCTVGFWTPSTFPAGELSGADADLARRALQCDELLVIRQHPVMPSHVYTYHVEGLRPAAACIATGCPETAARAS